METSDPYTVHAAGAVLWRESAGRPEVALVHRPRYDDWSLPKGKLDSGETVAHAAVREVAEETGLSCVLSRFLHRVLYSITTVRGEVPKQVDYFAARARDGAFTPNDEVDELRWLDVDRARQRLSYPHDAQVLDSFDRLPTTVVTVLLVRHALAGTSADWSGDDTLRPLSPDGLRQQAALRSLLPLFGPQRAYSAPRVRCEQTIAPTAEDLGLAITPEPSLSEEGYASNPRAGVDRLLRIAADGDTALVCSQGAVIPDLVARLAESGDVVSGNVAGGKVVSEKGSVWTLTFRREPHGDGPPMRLAAADYLPNPFPANQ
jgi:8-oxo-(d)GTP phosphatase